MMSPFGARVVDWQHRHGRHDLPWQRRDAYAVWISEIMLQQTQVATVIPYYHRFMACFPDVRALAEAPLDSVLTCWSGLGYYSRARNLHRAAQIICEIHDARFPANLEDVLALPGIGRSTAAAILVLGYGARHAILDGNVKRVLARHCGITGYPGNAAVAARLWAAADRLLPPNDVGAYTQGLMDLGATVCVRRNPCCQRCPVTEDCVARIEDRIALLPAPRPRKALPHRNTVMLVIEHAGSVLLEQRPASGVWGGLWCFPELTQADEAVTVCAERYGAHVGAGTALPQVKHGFTHFNLTISPLRVQAHELIPHARETGQRWMGLADVENAAIPAPVKRIVALVRNGQT